MGIAAGFKPGEFEQMAHMAQHPYK